MTQPDESDGSDHAARPAAEVQIRGALQAFEIAWNNHDAQAFSEVFAADADFTNVVGVHARGRAAVEEFHAPRFATHYSQSQLRILDARVRLIKADVAAVDAPWEMTGARHPQGQELALRKGLLVFVMTNENTRWLIKVMHNMDLRGPQP